MGLSPISLRGYMSLLVMDLMGEQLTAAKVLVSKRVDSNGVIDPLFDFSGVIAKFETARLMSAKRLVPAAISVQYDYYVLTFEDSEGREKLLYPGDFLIFPKAGDVYCLAAAAAKHLVNVE